MMIVSILVVCVGIPMAFMSAGSFSAWLGTKGIHANPNLAGGYPVAEFDTFDLRLPADIPQGEIADIEKSLAIRKFSVKKVAFRPFSGMGIAPRLNLVFEFDGQLPDPHSSASKFSSTAIHVYLKVPGRAAAPVTSDKVAQVDFGGQEWNYEVIIDGLHDQARVFDAAGNLAARGLGLYLSYDYATGSGTGGQAKRPVAGTTITAALPMEVLGDPAHGDWLYFVLVGLADSRHPSMIFHSGQNGRLALFNRAVPRGSDRRPSEAGDKPRLSPLKVANGN